MMTTKTYEISNRTSGQILGCYDGADESGALEACALNAGYSSFASQCARLGLDEDCAREDLSVVEVNTPEACGDDDRICLYEDNAGQLACTYRGVTYRGLERFAETETFGDVCEALRFGLFNVEPSSDPIRDFEELIASELDGDIEILRRPGIAGREILGIRDE